jgi:hypothetical protein
LLGGVAAVVLPIEGAGEEVDEPERPAVAEAELKDQVRLVRKFAS